MECCFKFYYNFQKALINLYFLIIKIRTKNIMYHYLPPNHQFSCPYQSNLSSYNAILSFFLIGLFQQKDFKMFVFISDPIASIIFFIFVWYPFRFKSCPSNPGLHTRVHQGTHIVLRFKLLYPTLQISWNYLLSQQQVCTAP